MKKAKSISGLILIIFLPLLIQYAHCPILFNTKTTPYHATGCGNIFFSRKFYANSIYFSNKFVYATFFDYGYQTFNIIGFSCETESANMTINRVSKTKITYTVEAPTSTESVTKIYIGEIGEPNKVTGCNTWSFDKTKNIIEITVIHNSPQDITINLQPINISKIVFPAVEMLGTVIFVAAVSIIFSAINGTPIDMDIIPQILMIAIIASTFILVLSVFIGKI